MRQLLNMLAATGSVLVVTATAAAQYPFPYQQNPYLQSAPNPAAQYQRPPVLSPYLNLNNRGNPAVNFFNFVQPQVQLQQPWVGYQGSALPPTAQQPGNDVVFDPGDPSSTMPRPSGHPSTFGSTGPYFNSLGTIGSGFGRSGGLQAPPQRRR